MTAVLTVATWYAGVYVGRGLYCGGVYAETTEPWVALPIQDASWRCGDLAAIEFIGETAADHQVLMARVLDAGPFGDNCVIRGDRCVPIAVDVPRHLWPDALEGNLSAPVRVTNVTALYRESCDLIKGHQ